ncbi:hypothetical protein HS7_12520 [Sulfolobales archaeon HS-7]|nr:hypothetical protein HS7_12520 [Sulfolobales archaeon HS-7]
MEKVLGPQTEEGLKYLFSANAEDYMRLLLISKYLDAMGMKKEAEAFREKANVELGHASAILNTLIKHYGLTAMVQDMAKEESEQHVSEYNKVAMAAKAEGNTEVESMLCSFSEQEKDIAETIKMGVKKLVEDMAKEESEQHVSEYNKVAMAAKAEGNTEVESMLCSFSEQEKDIAETIKMGVKKLVEDMAKEESEQHVSEYNKVAMAAKAEGNTEVESMLCSFSEQEKDIAETIKRINVSS